MAHEDAKQLLKSAGTFLERAEAVKAALALEMPLREIEDYLDWLDSATERRNNRTEEGRSADG
jgi:hypothetical protein